MNIIIPLATMHIVNFHETRTPQERGGPDNGFSVDLLCQSQTPCLSGHPPAANCEDLCRTQDSTTLPEDQANKWLGLDVKNDDKGPHNIL